MGVPNPASMEGPGQSEHLCSPLTGHLFTVYLLSAIAIPSTIAVLNLKNLKDYSHWVAKNTEQQSTTVETVLRTWKKTAALAARSVPRSFLGKCHVFSNHFLVLQRHLADCPENVLTRGSTVEPCQIFLEH